MSRSPFFYLETRNKDGSYTIVDPLVWNYDKTERVPADLWSYNGTHVLFVILKAETGYNPYPDFEHIRYGIPSDSCEEIKNGFNDDWFHPKWFTYADAQIYLLKNPKVEDYYAEWEEGADPPMIDNPIKGLLDRVDAFLEVWDDFGIISPSDIRIVYDVL